MPPCINASEADFLAGPNTIRYSLAALKNIGSQAVDTIVSERASNGSYENLSNFASRCNTKALNKRALETLSAAGAFDGLEPNRALVHGNVDQILTEAGRKAEDDQTGQGSLLGHMAQETASSVVLKLKPAKPWTPMERLQHEFDAIGFFLSGHPLDAYAGVLAKLGTLTLAELEARSERGVVVGRLAGVVVSARERRSQKGNKFAFAMFSEPTGQFEAVIFSETLAQSRHLLEPGTAVLVSVEGERDGETLKLRAQSIEALDAAAQSVQRGLRVVLDRRTILGNKATLDDLKAMLKPGGKGTISLAMTLEEAGRELEITLPGSFDVSPVQKGALSTVPGVLAVVEV
jgi:DNA polymerase III subunit alpha